MSLPEMTYVQSTPCQREVTQFVVTTYIVGSLLDRVANLRIQAIGDIDDGRSLLQNAESLDERRGKTLGRSTDVEVLQRPT